LQSSPADFGYETASGQLINKLKSSIFYSRRTTEAVKTKVKDWLQIEKEGGMGKYLGLREHFGRRKKDLFTSIVDKIKQKAISWSSRFLSGAGKQVMLQSVLTAIPVYAMSCFLLPLSLCDRIQSTLTRFWWDKTDQQRKMCWVGWDRLAVPKVRGGLGFKNFKAYNVALLAKQSWRVLPHPSCLLARVLLGKYCQNESFLKALSPTFASHGWRDLLAGRDLLRKQLGWTIGNDKSVLVWQDAWLAHDKRIQPVGPAPLLSKDWKVKDLFLPNSVDWDEGKIEAAIPFVKDLVLAIRPSRAGGADKRIWLGAKDGLYTTKTGYKATLCDVDSDSSRDPVLSFNWFDEVWNVQCSPKIRLFLWKAVSGALPVGSQLAIRIPSFDPVCCRCGELETSSHALFNCMFVQRVWRLAPLEGIDLFLVFTDVKLGLSWLKKKKTLPSVGLGYCALYPWICWTLWITRNQKVFSNILFSELETINKAIQDAKEWQFAQEPNSRFQVRSSMGLRAEVFSLNSTVIHTDAAWSVLTCSAGLGWTLKSPGIPLKKNSALSEHVPSPLVAEALVVHSALWSAHNLGLHDVILKSDCQVLTMAIISQFPLSEIHGILQDITSSSSSFSSFSCCHIPRTANVIADSLAKNSSIFVFSKLLINAKVDRQKKYIYIKNIINSYNIGV